MWSGGGGGGANNPNGSGDAFLEDPFDQQPATDAPAAWEGGGAWDEEENTTLPQRQPGEQHAPPIGEQHAPPPIDAAEARKRLGMGVCAIEAVVNGIQGAVIGSIFGIFGGVSEGMAAGARGKPLIQHTLLRARGSAVSFGAWIGTYRGAQCSMVVARGGKKDAFNAFAAGFVAGALPALPTRNPRVILFSALGSAGLMGSIEAAGSFFGGGGH